MLEYHLPVLEVLHQTGILHSRGRVFKCRGRDIECGAEFPSGICLDFHPVGDSTHIRLVGSNRILIAGYCNGSGCQDHR